MKKIIALGAAGVVAALALAGCGTEKATEQFKDAQRTGSDINGPMEVHDAPDGFGNWAEGCDGHGYRVFVLFHNDSPYGAISTQPDATCK